MIPERKASGFASRNSPMSCSCRSAKGRAIPRCDQACSLSRFLDDRGHRLQIPMPELHVRLEVHSLSPFIPGIDEDNTLLAGFVQDAVDQEFQLPPEDLWGRIGHDDRVPAAS